TSQFLLRLVYTQANGWQQHSTQSCRHHTGHRRPRSATVVYHRTVREERLRKLERGLDRCEQAGGNGLAWLSGTWQVIVPLRIQSGDNTGWIGVELLIAEDLRSPS